VGKSEDARDLTSLPHAGGRDPHAGAISRTIDEGQKDVPHGFAEKGAGDGVLRDVDVLPRNCVLEGPAHHWPEKVCGCPVQPPESPIPTDEEGRDGQLIEGAHDDARTQFLETKSHRRGGERAQPALGEKDPAGRG
jgi:hypothetical protein